MAKLSNQSNKDPVLRRQKGWIGFVHGYKKFTETVDWDKIKFTGKHGAKSVSTDEMNKITYKY